MIASLASDAVPFLPLFVPADRPERYGKAAAAGADAVIVDLEDAVADAAKDAARGALAERLRAEPLAVATIVRVNAAGTPFHEADIEALARLPGVALMLPKAEDADAIEALRRRLGDGRAMHALIETPQGMARAREIAASADRIAFGSIDYALSIGAAHRRDALLSARSELVLACALAGRPAPVDGVTRAVGDDEATRDDAAYASALGFGGKLLIHPAQVTPALRGFAPAPEEADAARRIVDAASGGEAARVDGAMVDRPVLERARATLARLERVRQRTGEAA